MGYHLNVKVVSLGKGDSVIAKAAYNGREKFVEQRTGETKDYTRAADRPVASFLYVDPKAPPEFSNRESAWNAIDAAATRKDAQLALNFIVAFPHQLTDQQREFIVKDFAREEFLRKGVMADIQIHRPDIQGDERNHHAHILVSMDRVGPGGVGERVFTWDDKEKNLAHWRQRWAARGAKELRKAGFSVEADRWAVGYLDLDRQRQAARERGDLAYAETLNRQPTKHRGPAVDAMQRKGKQTDRGQINSESVTAAQEILKLKAELAQIEKEIRREEIERGTQPRPPQDAPEHLQGTPAQIWTAIHGSDSAKAFAAALDEQGIALAVVTKEEADRSQRAAAFAKELGRFASAFRENEIVAVDERANVYRLSERTTGSTFGDTQRYLRTLERSTLHGIEDTRDYMRARADDEDRSRKDRDRTAHRLQGIGNIFDAGDSEDTHLKETVLDRTERRTIENERAASRPRNTRDR
jgi:hypothetical protein